MSFIDNIPEGKLRAFAESTHEKLQISKEEKSHLLKEITKYKKRLGIQEDGFIDTPSLNVVFFDSNTGDPYCEEHGAMNCYKNKLYRCVMCGVVVSLKNREVIQKEGEKTVE